MFFKCYSQVLLISVFECNVEFVMGNKHLHFDTTFKIKLHVSYNTSDTNKNIKLVKKRIRRCTELLSRRS